MTPTIGAVDRTERLFTNSATVRALPDARPTRDPLAFHRRLPGYAPSPLIESTALAASLGLDRLWIKDESERLGLPAFKILGASWAVFRAASARLLATTGKDVADWRTIDDLARQFAPLRPLTLTCATDGNHGRAVARMARLLGFDAHIFVPSDMAPARRAAIAGEGAASTVVEGTYDDAVDLAARATDRDLVIADTSWPGYEDVPRWVIDGYSTILWEIDDEIARRGEAPPDLVAVQIGVGALAAAVTAHYRRGDQSSPPVLLGVEPTRAACVLASMEAGEIVQIPGPHDSIMSGLNCGLPSAVAWPLLSRGIDAFVAIDDERARQAMRDLAGAGIVAGECGAAALAGLRSWLTHPARDHAITPRRAVIISTEGATDPAAYRQIVDG